MWGIVRGGLTALACLLVAGAALAWFTADRGDEPGRRPEGRRGAASTNRAEEAPASVPYPGPTVARRPDPNEAGGTVFLDPFAFDTGVFSAVARFTPPVGDERSLDAWREALAARLPRAREALAAAEARLGGRAPGSLPEAFAAIELGRNRAFVALYEGRSDEATASLTRALEVARGTPGVPAEVRAHLTALLGIAALRRGEQDNCIGCLGPSSCIFPIAREAMHTRPEGSREAIAWFTAYLDEWPGDLRVRWLRNIAAMTLGEYPEGVPARQIVPLAPFRSRIDVGRFPNAAIAAGLAARGPDLAGGSVFDDFDGDDRPDLLITSFDAEHGAGFFRNRGDGTFEDRSTGGGLEGQVYALNLARGDYDNDGRPDVVLLRGGWEKPVRLSLLRNRGGGAFEDVTVAAGLDEPIATESAAWGDYDNDGDLDLFVCGEYSPELDPLSGRPMAGEPDPRNRCRLYRNRGDGTFEDVAAAAGVQGERMAKGCSWGDYDNDGRLDLFVSNLDAPGRLYHNEGDGNFREATAELGTDTPPRGFTCTFWDYDNDGWQDLFVADYGSTLSGVVASYLGLAVEVEHRPRLLRNVEGRGFVDVSREAGLDRPLPCMSVNIGDIDNDGDLDLHLGTGWMNLSGLVPDVTYLNEGGRFEDVTESTGTGHLQKGHGVSFADYDADGDLDFFVVLGGGYPGDKGYSALFQNPGHGRHWLGVKLVGTTSNRSAIGARLVAEVVRADGTTPLIHRAIGNNGSFGGNSLVEHLGLGDATRLARLTITWPVGGTTQVLEDVPADRMIVVAEGEAGYRTVGAVE